MATPSMSDRSNKRVGTRPVHSGRTDSLVTEGLVKASTPVLSIVRQIEKKPRAKGVRTSYMVAHQSSTSNNDDIEWKLVVRPTRAVTMSKDTFEHRSSMTKTSNTFESLSDDDEDVEYPPTSFETPVSPTQTCGMCTHRCASSARDGHRGPNPSIVGTYGGDGHDATDSIAHCHGWSKQSEKKSTKRVLSKSSQRKFKKSKTNVKSQANYSDDDQVLFNQAREYNRNLREKETMERTKAPKSKGKSAAKAKAKAKANIKVAKHFNRFNHKCVVCYERERIVSKGGRKNAWKWRRSMHVPPPIVELHHSGSPLHPTRLFNRQSHKRHHYRASSFVIQQALEAYIADPSSVEGQRNELKRVLQTLQRMMQRTLNRHTYSSLQQTEEIVSKELESLERRQLDRPPVNPPVNHRFSRHSRYQTPHRVNVNTATIRPTGGNIFQMLRLPTDVIRQFRNQVFPTPTVDTDADLEVDGITQAVVTPDSAATDAMASDNDSSGDIEPPESRSESPINPFARPSNNIMREELMSPLFYDDGSPEQHLDHGGLLALTQPSVMSPSDFDQAFMTQERVIHPESEKLFAALTLIDADNIKASQAPHSGTNQDDDTSIESSQPPRPARPARPVRPVRPDWMTEAEATNGINHLYYHSDQVTPKYLLNREASMTMNEIDSIQDARNIRPYQMYVHMSHDDINSCFAVQQTRAEHFTADDPDRPWLALYLDCNPEYVEPTVARTDPRRLEQHCHPVSVHRASHEQIMFIILPSKPISDAERYIAEPGDMVYTLSASEERACESAARKLADCDIPPKQGRKKGSRYRRMSDSTCSDNECLDLDYDSPTDSCLEEALHEFGPPIAPIPYQAPSLNPILRKDLKYTIPIPVPTPKLTKANLSDASSDSSDLFPASEGKNEQVEQPKSTLRSLSRQDSGMSQQIISQVTQAVIYTLALDKDPTPKAETVNEKCDSDGSAVNRLKLQVRRGNEELQNFRKAVRGITSDTEPPSDNVNSSATYRPPIHPNRFSLSTQRPDVLSMSGQRFERPNYNGQVTRIKQEDTEQYGESSYLATRQARDSGNIVPDSHVSNPSLLYNPATSLPHPFNAH